MNYHLIQFIALLIVLIGSSNGKLSPDQNEKRLEKCGKSKLGVCPNNEDFCEDVPFGTDTFMVRVLTEGHSETTSGGFFISSRHIMTSTQSVADENRKWLLDNEEMKDLNNTMKVPIKYVRKIRIVWDNCTLEDKENKDCINNAMKAKDAYIFDSLIKDWYINYSPMLIELKEDHDDVIFPCIYHEDKDYEIPNSATRNIYGFTAESGFSKMNYRSTTYASYTSDNFHQTNGKIMGKAMERGGPLLVYDVESYGTTVIGIDSSTGHLDKAETTYSRDIRIFKDELCGFGGICQEDTWRTTTTKDVPSSTSSSSSELDIPINETNETNVTPNRSRSQILTTPISLMTHHPYSEEYEMNNEDEHDERSEIDDDILLSEDDRNDGNSRSFGWILVLIYFSYVWVQ